MYPELSKDKRQACSNNESVCAVFVSANTAQTGREAYSQRSAAIGSSFVAFDSTLKSPTATSYNARKPKSFNNVPSSGVS